MDRNTLDRDEIRQMYRESGRRRPAGEQKKGGFFRVFGSQFMLCASIVLVAVLIKNFTPEAVPTIAGTMDQVMGENTGFEQLGQELNDRLRSLPVFGGQVKQGKEEEDQTEDTQTAGQNEGQTGEIPEHNPEERQGTPDDKPPANALASSDEVINIKDAKIKEIPEDASGISFIGNTPTGATQVVNMSFTPVNYFQKYGDIFLSYNYGEDRITAQAIADEQAKAKAEAEAAAHAKQQEELKAAAKERKLTAEELALLDYPEKATKDKVDLGMTLTTPVTGRITDDFGWRNHPTAGDVRFHYGVDIASPKNTPIQCAFNGVVEKAGTDRAYGNYLYVRYNENLVVFYGHCESVLVKEGDRVSEGQEVALVGSTGISTGNHVHVELKYKGKNINPNYYINP